MSKLNNLDSEIQVLDEQRQMRNLANAIRLADSFSLLFVRCNQRPRQKEIIEELQKQLDGYKIKIILLEHQIEHLLDELQTRLGNEKYDAVFVYGLESSFPKAETAAESKFVVTLNHSRNSFKKVLNCPVVLFLPEYALSAIYHGATDFYSIRSGVYLFSAKAEETEQLISRYTSQGIKEFEGILLKERDRRIEIIRELLNEYKSLPDSQRNSENEYGLKEKLAQLYQVSGDYDTALSIYQEIIESAIRSDDFIRLGRNLNNLGIVYEELDNYTDAAKVYKNAIDITKKTVGIKHGNYVATLNNLASNYQNRGKVDRAIELYKEALDLAKELLGTKHPDYAEILNNLGLAYATQGKYNESITLYKESLSIVKETVGTEHLNYANRLNNLASVYFEQENYQKALNLYREAYSICYKILGRNHHRTKAIMQDIEMSQSKVKELTSRLIPYIN